MAGKVIYTKFGETGLAAERGDEEELGGVEKIRRGARREGQEECKRRKPRDVAREQKRAEKWQPFAESPVMQKLAAEADWARERGAAARKREEKEKERKRRAAIDGFYSDLKTNYEEGRITKKDIEKYLKEFPSGAQCEAYQKLSDVIKRGKIQEEIEKLRARVEDEAIKAGERERIVKPRRGPKVTVEAVGGRIVIAAPAEAEKDAWSAQEWYDFLLKEYATGKLTDKNIGNFFEDYPEGAREAHKKLLAEIKEEERKGPPFPEELSPPLRKLSQKEIDEIVLGFREYLQGLSVKESRIFERLQKVQMSEFKQILRDTISQEDIEKKVREIVEKEKIKPEEAEEKAENELVAEAAKKVFAERELVAHGFWGYDEEKGAWGLKHYSDLDGRCAMALLQKVGITSRGKYVPHNDWERGAINVDTGEKDGFLFEFDEETVKRLEKEMEDLYSELGQRKQELANLEQKAVAGKATAAELLDLDIKKELIQRLKSKIDKREQERWAIKLLTIFFDHHGPYSDRGTSATKVVYEVLGELGLIQFRDAKEKQAYDKLVEFVTQMDNLSYPEVEKYFVTSDRQMLGLYRYVNFENLLQFFQDGKKPTDILSDDDLRKYGLMFKMGKEKLTPQESRKKFVKDSLRVVEELAEKGWVIRTKDGKIFLCDTQNRLGSEAQLAAGSKGLHGVLRYDPKQHGFFVGLNKGKFDPEIFKDLPQGQLIRGSMFLHPPGREKLQVTLGDLVGRLAGKEWQPGPKSELKKFLDREQRLVHTTIFKIEAEWGEPKVGEEAARMATLEVWRAWTSDGQLVIVENLPPDFESGQKALVRLKTKARTILKGEDALRWGATREGQRKGIEVEYWIGQWESPEIPLPEKVAPSAKEVTPAKVAPVVKVKARELTPEEERRQEILKVIEGVVQKEIDKRRAAMERSPFWGRPEMEDRRAKALQEIEKGLIEHCRKVYKI